jgi:hypothetical protein
MFKYLFCFQYCISQLTGLVINIGVFPIYAKLGLVVIFGYDPNIGCFNDF